MGHDRDDSGPMSVSELAGLAMLFEEHRPRLLAMVRGRIDPALAARVDAEDVLHETFLLARRRWSRYGASGLSPYAWLYRLALDCLIEAWRHETRAGRDPRREMPWPDHSSAQLGLSLAGSATSPSKAVARDELCGQVRQVLDRLGPDDREVLRMRDVDGLPFRDVAPLLGISEAAAMKRYSRASRRFRALWREFTSSAGDGAQGHG